MAAAAGMRPVLQALTECEIIRQSYVLPAVELHRVGAAADSQAQRVGVFIFGTADDRQFGLVAVPGIRDELLMTAGPGAGVQLDTGAAGVVALVGELTNGLWRNPWGYALTHLIAAYRQDR